MKITSKTVIANEYYFFTIINPEYIETSLIYWKEGEKS